MADKPTKAPAPGQTIKFMGREITSDDLGLISVKRKGSPASVFPNMTRAMDAISFATGVIF